MLATWGRKEERTGAAEDISLGEEYEIFEKGKGQRIYVIINHLVHELELKYPGFNKRRLGYSDFELICQAEDITTWEDKIPWKGWYFLRNHYNFIVIKNSLSAFQKLFTAFHELGHYFTHAGGSRLRHYSKGQRKLEIQADIFAAVALVPTPLLQILESMHCLSARSLAGIFHLPEEFGEFRLKIFRRVHL